MFLEDEDPFIITTPAKQSAEEKRKVIRRHVMRGKNRRRAPPRPQSWIDGAGQTPAGNAMKFQAHHPNEAFRNGDAARVLPAMDSELLDDIRRLRRGMYPLDVAFGDGPPDVAWSEPVKDDPACLHFSIFIAKTYGDFIKNRTDDSDEALAHFVESLTILQKRLADGGNQLATSSSTMLVVVGLALAATAVGDFAAASGHLSGLSRLVMLRGGLGSLKENKMLQTKICRVDIGVVIGSGCKPTFFNESISWDPFLAVQTPRPSPNDNHGPSLELEQVLDTIDTRLRVVWNDVFEFTRAANIAAQCKRDLDGDMYQEAMVSISYRLINLSFEAGSLNELLRLAILSFSSTLFLQWRGAKIRFDHLARSFKSELTTTKGSLKPIPQPLTLWLLLNGAIAVFDLEEQVYFRPDLIEVTRELALKSWKDVKLSLKTLPWVDVLHDAPAEQLIEDAMSAS